MNEPAAAAAPPPAPPTAQHTAKKADRAQQQQENSTSMQLEAPEAPRQERIFGAQNVKIMVVGDEGVGKSSVNIKIKTDTFPESENVRLHFLGISGDELYVRISLVVDEVGANISLWDTEGADDYDRLRPMCYAQTDVFLVCFDMANPDSFDNVRTKWAPEIQHHAPGIPIMLVGLKSDLEVCVGCNDDAAKALCAELGFAGFVQCSAKTQTRDELRTAVVEEAVRIARRERPRPQMKMRMRPSMPMVAAAVVVAPVVVPVAAVAYGVGAIRRRCLIS